MAKAKETKRSYSTEPITVVTARGTTEIPRALRERYRVTAKSRLRWTDTGKGLLVVPVEKTAAPRVVNQRDRQAVATRQENLDAIKILREWMQEPDDWTPEQWDEFERELRENRFHVRDVEL
jgi:bifunctional DNA-binding transcriptional regulator/antitoxin component of YhaV-PrlF toxin-antitoxin module